MPHGFLNRSPLGTAALFALSIVSILVVGYGAAHLLEWVRVLGHYIPHKALGEDYVFAVIWAMFLALTIWVWPIPKQDKPAVLGLWLAKCAVALGFMLFYESRYGLDAYFYYEQSVQVGAIDWHLSASPMGPSNQIIINLASLQHHVLPDSFHGLKVSFAMIGLVAIYIFYRAAVIFLGYEDLRVLYAVGLFPSIIFWSSIIGKDPIVLLGIALYVYGVIAWWRYRRRRDMLVGIVGLLVAMAIRVWLAPIMLAPLAGLAWWGIRTTTRRFALLGLIVAVFWISVRQVNEKFHVETTQDLVKATHQISHSWNYGGSGRESGDFTSITEMVATSPFDAFTALFRPLPGEVSNLFGYLAGLENLLLLLALFFAIVRTSLRELRDPLVTWAILLVLAWSSVYGFVSSQNLGSAVRFKLQILPILWGLLLYFGRPRGGVTIAVPAHASLIRGTLNSFPQDRRMTAGRESALPTRGPFPDKGTGR